MVRRTEWEKFIVLNLQTEQIKNKFCTGSYVLNLLINIKAKIYAKN